MEFEIKNILIISGAGFIGSHFVKLSINEDNLKVNNLSRGYAWLDTGTTEGLLDSANFIATIKRRQGIKVSCLDEIAWRKSWIKIEDLKNLPSVNKKSNCSIYLNKIIEGAID